jgi:glyoxylase-like metal-dependent hydrolase (beta-lactamase superfamily II)
VFTANAADTSSESLRLYILDCGTIDAMNPELFGLKAEEIAGDASFVSPCYLVVHPRGSLVWDVGQVPDENIPDDGTEVSEQEILKATRRLSTQLRALGHELKDITYMAMSHYHVDHTANANSFVNSTWIVQQPEYDVMFGDQEVGILGPETYKDLENSKRIMLQGEDHDVFGDGSVIIKFAPGHTPGHQMLFLRLKNFGPLLLSGDLWHLPEERTLDRVPTFDADGELTRESRQKIEKFIEETGAQMWIQHDPPTYATLKKAPQYYD